MSARPAEIRGTPGPAAQTEPVVLVWYIFSSATTTLSRTTLAAFFVFGIEATPKIHGFSSQADVTIAHVGNRVIVQIMRRAHKQIR